MMMAWLMGCEANPLPAGGAGGAAGTAGAAGDGGAGGVAGAGGRLDMGPMTDMAVTDGGAGGGLPTDQGLDLDGELDQAVVDMEVIDVIDLPDLGAPVDPPSFEQVAVVSRGAETFFVWATAEGLMRLHLDADGEVTGGPELIDTPEYPIERVVGLTIAGDPWVAYGSVDQLVVLLQVDLVEQTRQELPGLYGPPLLAAAQRDAMVVARTLDGLLAWRVVDQLTLDPGFLYIDEIGLPMPDDAAGVPAGVVMHFADAGQCVQISDIDWRASGNFPCVRGDARMISDGLRPLMTHLYDFRNNTFIAVRSIYEEGDSFGVDTYQFSDQVLFANDGPRRPVIGGRLGGDDAGRVVLTLIGPTSAYSTVETWANRNSVDYPFDDVRAVAQRALPRRQRPGICSDSGAQCQVDDDCEGTCDGVVGAMHAITLGFRSDGYPLIDWMPLVARPIGAVPYQVSLDSECTPEPERCDLVDQNCNGRVDDGRCCPGTSLASYRWETPLRVGITERDGREEYDIVIGEYLGGSYRIMYRLEGTNRWEGKFVGVPQGGNGEPGELRVSITGAANPKFLLSLGGTTAMVAQVVIGDDEPGPWTVFFRHPDRDTPEENPVKAQVELGCDEVLAAATLSHRGIAFGNEVGENMIVVCADRIVRVFAVQGAEDFTYTLQDLNLPEPGLRWATINRDREDTLSIVVGFRTNNGLGPWNTRRFRISNDDQINNDDGALDPPALEPSPEQFQLLGNDAVDPLYVHPALPLGRPPIQITADGRVRLAQLATNNMGNQFIDWREALLTRNPEQVVFAGQNFHVFASNPVVPDEGFEEATGWWAIDVRGDEDFYNLWSTEPLFIVNGPVARWYAPSGPYGRYDLLIVTPTDQTDRRWRAVTRHTVCNAP